MRTDPRQTPEAARRTPPPTITSVDAPQPPERSVAAADIPSDVPSTPTVTEAISLLPEEAASQFRSRWDMIQGGFVDDPRRAVDQAGALVEDALQQLSAVFEEKRSRLQGNGGIPTEELRQTLRHYRLLLNRLF